MFIVDLLPCVVEIQTLSTLLDYGGKDVALLIGSAIAVAIILRAVATVIHSIRQ